MAALKAAAKAKGMPLYKYVGEGRTLPVPLYVYLLVELMLIISLIFKSL